MLCYGPDERFTCCHSTAKKECKNLVATAKQRYEKKHYSKQKCSKWETLLNILDLNRMNTTGLVFPLEGGRTKILILPSNNKERKKNRTRGSLVKA